MYSSQKKGFNFFVFSFQSDEGCDSPDSSDGSTQVSSQVVVTSPASDSHPSHYIVAGMIYLKIFLVRILHFL